MGILPNHPVVHGLHQHQNHIFPCQKAGHFIVFRGVFLRKPGIHLRPARFVGFGIRRGQRVDVVGVNILAQGLVHAADLVKPVGIEHILICRLGGLHPAEIRAGILDIFILLKLLFRQALCPAARQQNQNQAQSLAVPFHLPAGELPHHQHAQGSHSQNSQPPSGGVTQQNIRIIGAFGSVAEIGKPHHLLKQVIVARLHNGVDRRQCVQHAIDDPSRLFRQGADQGAEHHRPQCAKGKRPELSGSKGLSQKAEAKQLHQEKGQRDQEKPACPDYGFLPKPDALLHRRLSMFLFFLLAHGICAPFLLPSDGFAYCSTKKPVCTLKIFLGSDNFHKKCISLL